MQPAAEAAVEAAAEAEATVSTAPIDGVAPTAEAAAAAGPVAMDIDAQEQQLTPAESTPVLSAASMPDAAAAAVAAVQLHEQAKAAPQSSAGCSAAAVQVAYTAAAAAVAPVETSVSCSEELPCSSDVLPNAPAAAAFAVAVVAAPASECTPCAAAAAAAAAAVESDATQQLRAAQQEVCQLLAAVCVMLRLSTADQLPAALRALRALPELPEGEARGLCSLCGHYEALTAYAVSSMLTQRQALIAGCCTSAAAHVQVAGCDAAASGNAMPLMHGLLPCDQYTVPQHSTHARCCSMHVSSHAPVALAVLPAAAAMQVGTPTDRDWSVFCSNCHHLACEQQQQQQQPQQHVLPSLRHKRAKALRECSRAMRVAGDDALDDLACLAGHFSGQVEVPDFSCTLQVRGAAGNCLHVRRHVVDMQHHTQLCCWHLYVLLRSFVTSGAHCRCGEAGNCLHVLVCNSTVITQHYPKPFKQASVCAAPYLVVNLSE
jgi:hypothetical protein